MGGWGGTSHSLFLDMGGGYKGVHVVIFYWAYDFHFNGSVIFQ